MTQNIRADLKILVIGSSGVGKTSFVQRWTKGQFTENHSPTIVSEFGFKIFEYKEKKYRIQLWDIGGQDKSPHMAKIFARDSLGCLVFSDCTKKETLEETLDWKKVINDEGLFPDGEKLPFLLVQNKIDLIEDKMELEECERTTQKWAEDNKFIKHYMTSVKLNQGVDDVMNYFIGHVVDRLEEYVQKGGEVFAEQRRKETIVLNDSSFSIEEKKGCC
jgi:small GTP-binding protein